MLVPMSKEEFVARMIADAKRKQEEKEEAKRVLAHYICERQNRRQHIYHRRSPKRRLGV